MNKPNNTVVLASIVFVAIVTIIMFAYISSPFRVQVVFWIEDTRSSRAIDIPPISSIASATLYTELEDTVDVFDVAIRRETIYRGTNLVMMTTSKSNISSRFFFCDNVARFEERDENGDGYYESMIISSRYTPYGFEAFIREPDGAVRPLDAEEYIRMEKQMRRHLKSPMNSGRHDQ